MGSSYNQQEPSTKGTWPILSYRILVLNETQNDYYKTGNTDIYTYYRLFFHGQGTARD